MKDCSIKKILSDAHVKAMSRSLTKEALKKEASNYEPMTMLWVGHVSTIVLELLWEYKLMNKINVELDLMDSLIKASSNNDETCNWLKKQRDLIAEELN